MNTFLFIIAVILIIYFIYKNIIVRPKHFPPGPSLWIPFFGHWFSIIATNYKYTHQGLDKLSKYYKSNVLGFYLGPFPTIVACDEKSIKELLMRPEFQGRIDQVVSLLRVDFEEERGIIFTDGDLWQQQKRFMLRHLRDYGYGKRSDHLEKELQDEVMEIVKFLKKETNNQFCKNGNVLVPNIFAWGNINLLLSALIGKKYSGDDGREMLQKICKAGLDFQLRTEPLAGPLTYIPFTKYIPPFKQSYDCCIKNNEFLANVAEEYMNKKMESFDDNEDFKCALDVFVYEMRKDREDNKLDTYFTEKQLKLVIQDFMFPASTTISGTLGYLWQQLILHPEEQTKIQEEIDRVVGGRNIIPSLNHREEMHYTEAVIREILRMKTLVPLAIPHRATEDTEFMGYFVKEGTIMIPNLYSLHNSKEYWGDPESFRPSRFLDENGKIKKKDPTLPFGIGKRLCPGETFSRQNMFMYVTILLQHFSFTLPEGANLPDHTNYYPGLNTHPVNFWVKFIPRE